METGIRIGHEANHAQGVADSIVAIIEASPDREVAVAALAAFTQATSISGVSISGSDIGVLRSRCCGDRAAPGDVRVPVDGEAMTTDPSYRAPLIGR